MQGEIPVFSPCFCYKYIFILNFKINDYETSIIFFVFFTIIYLQSSCFGIFKNNFESEYSHVYSDQNDDASKRIDINGFYYEYSADSLKNQNWGLLFFNDGTCNDFLFNEEAVDTITNLNNLDLMPCVMTFNKKKKKYLSGYDGYYKLQGDTIIEYRYYYYMLSYSMDISRFVILNRQTIKLISIEYREDEKWHKYNLNSIYHFHPAHNLPTTDYLWIKEKKWFWKKGYYKNFNYAKN